MPVPPLSAGRATPRRWPAGIRRLGRQPPGPLLLLIALLAAQGPARAARAARVHRAHHAHRALGANRTHRTRPAHRTHRAHRPSRHRARPVLLAMRTQPLPPTWTVTTDGREVAVDGEPDDPARPIRIRSSRHRLTRIACYQELRRRHIPFQPGPSKGGLIAFPVVTNGHIGGIVYRNKYTRDPMLADCQLVLGLYRAAGVFRRHNIREVLYTNTWRPPFWNFARHRSMPARGRRMGQHPRGLAMDASVFIDRQGRRYEVQPHWEKLYGGPGNCVGPARTREGRLLRSVICDLERAHIFRRILTPDSNWEHRHHFHFTAARANEAFVRERWAGRVLTQPLPGTPTYSRWHRWHLCYRIRSPRRRWRCYRRRRKLLPRPPRRYSYKAGRPRVALVLVLPKASPEPEPEATARALDSPAAEPGRHPQRPQPRRSAPHRARPRSPEPAQPTRPSIRRALPPRPEPAQPPRPGPRKAHPRRLSPRQTSPRAGAPRAPSHPPRATSHPASRSRVP